MSAAADDDDAILPLLLVASDLTPDSPVVEIDALLQDVIAAGLDNLRQERVLTEIRARTDYGLGQLRLRMAGIRREYRIAIAAAGDGPNLEVVDAKPPDYSDEALALRFAAKHAANLRYTAAWGRWSFWEETYWQEDQTLRAFDLARAVCRIAAAEIENSDVASAKTVAGITSLARADRRLAATVAQWDADLWSMATPAGIADLRTGELSEARREAYMTKTTAVAPGGECPRWLKFLEEITDGDAELEAFLQRMAGYCLTGETREQALFFCYGTGGNGKGVFLNTLRAIMADYATVAPIETFTDTGGNKHPTELAGLRGARLVAAQETEEGRRWAESKIKMLTGGDPISARFMHQNFFEYIPQFKLVIAGNHKPALRGVDEAIRRRFRLVPFTVKIADPDKDLPAKLRDEWPGILAWMIRGCLDWQRVGLAPPAAVLSATDAYLEAEDAVTLWIAEACITGPNNQDRVTTLFKSWSAWAEAAGEFIGSQKRLKQALEDRGFESFKSATTRQAMMRGLVTKADVDPGFSSDWR